MAFSRDRDLLAREPKVFAEAVVAGQEKMRRLGRGGDRDDADERDGGL